LASRLFNGFLTQDTSERVPRASALWQGMPQAGGGEFEKVRPADPRFDFAYLAGRANREYDGERLEGTKER